jgi:hypothetical protein
MPLQGEDLEREFQAWRSIAQLPYLRCCECTLCPLPQTSMQLFHCYLGKPRYSPCEVSFSDHTIFLFGYCSQTAFRRPYNGGKGQYACM